jgi:hypothetical protein
MYSYVIGFNLDERGDDANEFLTDMARQWPELWERLPGVTGTLLLASALALGGEFDYQWRVDIATLSTLAEVDTAMKTDRRWRTTRSEWLRHRTVARAHLSEYVSGDKRYTAGWREKTDGAVHFVHHSTGAIDDGSADRVERAAALSGVVGAQTLRSDAGGLVGTTQTWLRLTDLGALDTIAEAGLGVGAGRLFGELREVEGVLFGGA